MYNPLRSSSCLKDWEDPRSRIDPPNRRCFAFFHQTVFHAFADTSKKGCSSPMAPYHLRNIERNYECYATEGNVEYNNKPKLLLKS
jgi:hypothetical protein